MERLSLAAFWVSFAFCALATVIAWAPLLAGALGAPALGFLSEPAGAFQREPLPDITEGTSIRGGLTRLPSWITLGALVISLTARGLAAGRPPLTDLWEFTVAFAAAVSVFQHVFERKTPGTNANVALQPLLLLLLVAAAFLPSRIQPLAPSLRSGNILVAHVAVMVVAYGALTVSFGAALLQLLQGSGRRFASLPAARWFDGLAYRAAVVGFPLLALGIALGAYWASRAWGRYWGWDPKETSSLVTWLAYGVYFHVRSLRSWSGRRSAIVLVLAYGCVLFSYFGVNLWVSGLHSYAGG
jgi:cytochrome c-type biogenesis protein CcsB